MIVVGVGVALYGTGYGDGGISGSCEAIELVGRGRIQVVRHD